MGVVRGHVRSVRAVPGREPMRQGKVLRRRGEQLGHDPIKRYVAQRAGDSLTDIQHGIFELARRHGNAVDDQTVLLVRIK